jgi:hypothetical protein
MWLQDRRAEGWQAVISDSLSTGFPHRFALGLQDLALADPATGVAVQTSQVSITAPSYWPGYVTLHLPSDPMLVASPMLKSQVQAQEAVANLRLHPGHRLELDTMALTSAAWSLGVGETPLVGAGDLTLAMVQDETNPLQYGFDVQAGQLEIGATLRSALRVPQDWPVRFDTFALRAKVQFDAPWDRFAIERERPQPRRISLDLAQARWGDLNLRLAGDLDVDAAGVPTGKISVQAQNWRDMLDLAQTTGLLPRALRQQAEDSLNALASLTGNPNSIDVQLNFVGGMIAVGFIPLGPAPRLIIR